MNPTTTRRAILIIGLILASIVIVWEAVKYTDKDGRTVTITKGMRVAMPPEYRATTGYDSIQLVVWYDTVKAYFTSPNENLLKNH